MSIDKSALDYRAFHPFASEFHLENALFLAKNARLAYETAALQEHVCREIWGFPNYRFLEYRSDEDDVQAYVTANAEVILVSFRGTEARKLQDWVNNMDTQLVERFRGQVHRGFIRSIDLIWDDLTQVIQEFRTQNQMLFFCGHSQGGALTNLAVAQALASGMPLHQAYTFGQPRAGNLLFAGFFNKQFKSKYFRIVNHGDIITRAPTRKSDYSHCGTFIFLDKQGLMHTDSAYWTNFWDDLGLSIWDLLDMAIAEVEEHKTSTYISKLAGL